MSYAVDTSVSVERSRAELESILSRYGAGRFGYMSESDKAVVIFEAHGKSVKFTLPIPGLDDPAFIKTGKWARKQTPEQLRKAREQVCRSRWRALCLCVKAKLEAVESGITSFEAEFLSHFCVPGGGTLGDKMIPQLEEMRVNGRMPLLQLK